MTLKLSWQESYQALQKGVSVEGREIWAADFCFIPGAQGFRERLGFSCSLAPAWIYTQAKN